MRVSQEWLDKLKQEQERGYIRVQKHPEKDLFIYNYSQTAQADRHWNEVTRKCRGLVLDGKGEVIIKCPEKFFNLHEPEAAKIDLDTCRISEKLDGYYISIKNDSRYGLIVTSRGSFDNQYVAAAKTFIDPNKLKPNYSYFCELLMDFPGDENIIVMRHPEPQLVCWGMKNEKYEELTPDSTFPIAKTIGIKELKQYLENEVEGVVAQDPTTFERVKIKTLWYINRHRLISNCSRKRVMEVLKEGNRVQNLEIPDEILPQMLEWQRELLSKYRLLWLSAQSAFEEAEHLSDKEIGLSKIPPVFKHYIFQMRKNRGKQALEGLWKQIKP